MIAPVVVIIILLVALVFTGTAHAAVLHDLSQKQAETSEIKTQLEITAEEKEKLANQVKELEVENADLKAKRQAKLEELARATRKPDIQTVAVSGSCSEWLASAGVTDTYNAMWLINKESGCNPYAVNRSSGACGVAQELPCGKSGCSLGDGACQVAWMQSYVFARYGSWANAVSFHLSHNWY